MVTFVTLDPLVLRRRFSPVLPLSNKKKVRTPPENKAASQTKFQARRALIDDHLYLIFGNLAVIVTIVTLDPLALRRRFSPVLPFSDFSSIFLSANYINTLCQLRNICIIVIILLNTDIKN
jgi:hypothetical protein